MIMNNFMEEYKKLQEEQEGLKKENEELKVKTINKHQEIYKNFIEKNIDIFNFLFDIKEKFGIQFINYNKRDSSCYGLYFRNDLANKRVYIEDHDTMSDYTGVFYDFESKKTISQNLYMLEKFVEKIGFIQGELEKRVKNKLEELKTKNQELVIQNNKYINKLDEKTKSVYSGYVYSVYNDDYFLDVFDDKEKSLKYAKTLKGNIKVREYKKSIEWCEDVFNSSKCVDIEFKDEDYVKTIYICEDLI